jgi:hypothetical protein
MIIGRTGTYSANCNSVSGYHGINYPETESASIIPGSSVSTYSSGAAYNGGFAEADFSAQYIFTITGGDLVTIDAPAPYGGLGAWVDGCLSTSAVGIPHPNPPYHRYIETTADLSPTAGPYRGFGWGISGAGDYSTCVTGFESFRVLPLLLNVPVPMELTLHAYTSVYDTLEFPNSATAQFTGFQFFDNQNNGNPIDVTYTLTLAEQLPPLPLPEPGSLAMMSGAAILLLIFGLRRGLRPR